MEFLYWILIGALVGWIASKIWKTNMGLLGYILLGIAGSWVGGFIFRILGLTSNTTVGSLITSVIGALVVLFILGKIKK